MLGPRSRTTLYSVGPLTETMMLHAHRLRGSKGTAPILIFGLLPIGHYGAPSTLERRLPGNASSRALYTLGRSPQG